MIFFGHVGHVVGERWPKMANLAKAANVDIVATIPRVLPGGPSLPTPRGTLALFGTVCFACPISRWPRAMGGDMANERNMPNVCAQAVGIDWTSRRNSAHWTGDMRNATPAPGTGVDHGRPPTVHPGPLGAALGAACPGGRGHRNAPERQAPGRGLRQGCPARRRARR